MCWVVSWSHVAPTRSPGSTETGCSAGSQTHCTRRIVIQGPAGLPGLQVAQRALGQLARVYGWHPFLRGPGYCHTEGWQLDSHQVCASITASQRAATITMQTSDPW
jgi:hypothetical protein